MKGLNMADHNELGIKGEAIAKNFLLQKGYQILSCNYRFKKFEIDIICLHKDLLVVVEVKTRQTQFMAGPDKTVSKSKQKAIISAANAYIIENEIDNEVRFDIVSIILNEHKQEIEHLKDAFYPLL
jgi:putative endonuclease